MKKLILSAITFLMVFVLTFSITACAKEPENSEITPPPEHTEHTYNKGFCECGEIDLTYNTPGLSFELMGEGDSAYYSVTGYAGSDKKVLISSEYDGKAVKEIGEGAFQGQLNRVTFINLPDTIEKIGKDAFDSCTSIKKIVIPESVKVIGEHAFKNCYNVTEIYFKATECEIEYVKHVEGKSGEKNGYCNPFVKVGAETEGVVLTIAKNVKVIPYCAFYLNYAYADEFAPNISGTANIIKVVFEDESECKEIKDNAFMNVRSIETFEFGENCKVETIGNSVFGNCEKITEISIPENVTTIGRYAFSACKKLERVNLGKLDGWNLYTKGNVDKIENFDIESAKTDGESVSQTVARLMTVNYPAYSWTQE